VSDHAAGAEDRDRQQRHHPAQEPLRVEHGALPRAAEALTLFKTGNFAFDAQATAVALKSGAGANAKYSNGVAVFTMDESGLMFEASIGGQKFSFQAK
jgi:hypothetical protein